jgi:7-cyano-7-deazaguanine synthase in queuosine biosynthesis
MVILKYSLYRQITKIIVKCVNKVVKLFCVIHVREHTILCVWTQSWRRLQRVNGHVLIVREKVFKNKMMMNTWSSAGNCIMLAKLPGIMDEISLSHLHNESLNMHILS